MAILFSNEIYAAISEELQNATDSVQILTAFGKKNAIAAVIEKVNSNVSNKRIMFRFRLDDLLRGSTDFDILEYCRNQGWSVYVRFDLHAKTYIVDNKRGIVGSANATSLGLSLSKSANFEMAAFVDVEPQDILKINSLFQEALFVDDNLLMDFYEEYKRGKESGVISKVAHWSESITKRFSPHINALFSYELPEKGQYSTGEYIQFLDTYCPEDLVELKEVFRWSVSYMWLLDNLVKHGGQMYFGELSSQLHNDLVTDPRPFRKDVKQLLANLLSLIEFLDMPNVGVDRPNYSQRVYLK